MDPEPPIPAADTRVPTPRTLTPRALAIGGGLCAVFAVAAPLNDWVLGNTLFYCHYLPPAVLVATVVLALVVNPLLGRRRLVRGELTVVVTMLLALGGVASSGFPWGWTQVVSGPAKVLNERPALSALASEGASVLPTSMFIALPAEGPPQVNDAEHRLVIDGFYSGLSTSARVQHRATVRWRDAQGVEREQLAMSGTSRPAVDDGTWLDLDQAPGSVLLGMRAGESIDGLEVVAVTPPGIPWHAWWPVFLRWLPLILGSLTCFVALAGIVRRQWIHHERLPFPTAAVFADLIEDPQAGFRIAPLMRKSGFAIGVAVAAVVLGSQCLHAWGLLPVAIPTRLDLTVPLGSEELKTELYNWRAISQPRVFLSIVALTFFLPSDLAFSLWFFFVATNLLFLFLRRAGIPVDAQNAAQAGVGAFAGECLLLLWIGRRYYGAAVIAALRGGRDEDQRAVATYMRALLIGAGAMVAMLVTLGAPLFHAALAVLLLLGFMLVLARMVAEAGIPFVQTPTGCFLTEVLFSLTGVALPATALAPLMLVGAGLMSDTRESLLPYAVQAEYLGDRAGVPRRRLSALMLLVAATGAAACTAMVVWIFYSGDHIPDSWPLSTLSRDNLQPLADVVDGRPPADSPWAAYGIGMALVGAVGIARMMFAWWPLHPLGAIVVPSASTAFIWFSFFIGWLVKIGVMRYGGVGLYQRLRPFAIGLIVGEALVAALFLVIGMALRWAGVNLPQLPHFLPG